MLGLTRLPPWFEKELARFKSVFSDSRNVESFTALVSAVILATTQWTVSGLSRRISRPDGDAKSDRTYRYFLGKANWSATTLAQQTAAYVFDQLDVGAGDEVLLHVDDTHVGKTGDATDGVAELYNPAEGELELGNKFVTSCIQVDEVYVPYLARMYIKEELAPNFEQPFKKKTEIAVDDIITPLQLPVGAALTVVFDSAYYGGERVASIQEQGHDVICRYKSSNHVSPLDEVGSLRVDEFSSTLEYEQTTITVRGDEKTYRVSSEIVEIDGVGPVKIVASKTDDGTTRYYLSTDLGRSAAEILELVEDRWNIETVHQESNKKFGFKQYQLERKQAIERYLQLVFLAWTLVTFSERANVAFWEERGGLSVRLDHAQEAYHVETLLDIFEEIDPSLPRGEQRVRMRELVRSFSWSSVANFLITLSELINPLNERCGFCRGVISVVALR